MGKSHSKTEKSPSFVINEKISLSPRQKRGKLKKENERKKQQKTILMKKNSILDNLKFPRPPLNPQRSEMSDCEDIEVEIKRHMQNQLAFNSDIFVLNQMLMSVQFFANFDRYF